MCRVICGLVHNVFAFFTSSFDNIFSIFIVQEFIIMGRGEFLPPPPPPTDMICSFDFDEIFINVKVFMGVILHSGL